MKDNPNKNSRIKNQDHNNEKQRSRLKNKDQDSKEQFQEFKMDIQDSWKKIKKTRWTSKLTKKIKGIGKPETRTVLWISNDTNPINKTNET